MLSLTEIVDTGVLHTIDHPLYRTLGLSWESSHSVLNYPAPPYARLRCSALPPTQSPRRFSTNAPMNIPRPTSSAKSCPVIHQSTVCRVLPTDTAALIAIGANARRSPPRPGHRHHEHHHSSGDPAGLSHRHHDRRHRDYPAPGRRSFIAPIKSGICYGLRFFHSRPLTARFQHLRQARHAVKHRVAPRRWRCGAPRVSGGGVSRRVQ